MKFQILVADDHAIIRDGIKKILRDTDDLEVAGEAANGHEVLERVREREWSAIVMDLSMPGRNGLELVKLVHSECPKLPMLIFSMHPEEQFAVRAIRAGALGYLSKESSSDLLLPAIRKVVNGSAFISAKVAELLASDLSRRDVELPHTRLSDREFEVFSRIVRGARMSDIAEELSLSIKTVSTHKSNILAKMEMKSNMDLLRYALDHNLMDASTS